MKHLTIERLVMGGVTLLIGLLLGWMVRGVATYNPDVGTAQTFKDWRLICPAASAKDAYCEIDSDIANESANPPATLARVTITTDSTDKKAPKPILGFTVPLGVALEPGLSLQIDKDPAKTVAYRTCDAVGCIAVTDFDAKLAKSLDNASDVYLVLTGLDGKQQRVALSLDGYQAARDAYNDTESRRHNWFWRLLS